MRTLKKLVKKLPLIRTRVERDHLRAELDRLQELLWSPPGHFYSPIPSLEEIRKNEQKIFGSTPRNIPGIDLREKEQMDLFEEFKKYYEELPFKPDKTGGMRYFFENEYFSYSDAIFLYCMMRHVKPKRIIEVGSGYSSCLILDTNELFFNGSIECTFIEPYPERLLSLVKNDDLKKVELITKKLQDVPLNKLSSLDDGDFLFIDSTHVSKTNSDVNYILFEILPHLKAGVHIHIHDIFYPFEYLKEWVYEGRAWNECYFLRAFLQYNQCYKIVFFSTFLEYFYEDRFVNEMPLCMKDKGGSIWLRKECSL